MAFDKKILFSDLIEEALVANSAIIGFARKPYEGDMVQGGSVKVKSYNDAVTIGDFVQGTPLNRQLMTGSTKTLVIDNAKYFNIEVGDIDKVQAGVDLGVYAEQAAMKLKNEVETSLWALRTSATQLDKTLETLTVDNIVEIIEEGRVALADANVEGEKVMIVNNYVSSILNRAGLLADTSEFDGTYGPKKIKRFGDDVIVLVSNIAQPAVGTTSEILIGSMDFLNYAGSLSEVDAYRPEDSFSDAIKGLHVFGTEVFNSVKGINITVTK